jgi:hypothetical protein
MLRPRKAVKVQGTTYGNDDKALSSPIPPEGVGMRQAPRTLLIWR